MSAVVLTCTAISQRSLKQPTPNSTLNVYDLFLMLRASLPCTASLLLWETAGKMQGSLGSEYPCVSLAGINHGNLRKVGYYVIYQYNSSFKWKDNVNDYRSLSRRYLKR